MNRKSVKKMTAVILSVMMLSAFSGCRGDNETDSASFAGGGVSAAAGDGQENVNDELQKITGSWSDGSGSFSYSFRQDGTGEYDVSGKKMKFTYKLNDNRLRILYKGNKTETVLGYGFRGDLLIIKDSFGNETVYERK